MTAEKREGNLFASEPESYGNGVGLTLASPTIGVGLAPCFATTTSGRSFPSSVPASIGWGRFSQETLDTAIASTNIMRQLIFI